ncbi:MAG: DUF2764 family protein [Bacteroidaceae bacterium]|nr:DUF2764 family protein [Bacteroidaceae bacterium]
MGKYYYLIAGLADISLDDSKAPASVESLREELYEALDAADRKVMDMLLLENDCRNLLSALSEISALSAVSARNSSLFSEEQLQDLIACVKTQEQCPAGIPQFMYNFVQEYQDESWRDKAAFAEDRLWSLFYEYAMNSKNEFVRSWYEFNLDLNNILSAMTARKYNLDAQKVIVGSNATAQALRTSGARDWGLSQEVDFFDEVMRLLEEDDLSQRERKTDLIRWHWLEEHTFFDYFTVERLFSYMVRLGMVERWTTLDKEKGQQLFRKLIGELKAQTSVPAEFR